MDFFPIPFICSITIVPIAIIGVTKIKRVDSKYQPFLFYLFWYSIIILTSSVYAFFKIQNHFVLNINGLVVFILLSYYFRLWKYIKSNYAFYASLFLVLVSYSYESFVLSTPFIYNTNTSMLYSFFLIIFSIASINQIVINSQVFLLKNPKFLISAGLLFYYCFNFVITAFGSFRLGYSSNFLTNLYIIEIIADVIKNIFFFLAIIWIPRKRKFSL